jgi:hypothetical protein
MKSAELSAIIGILLIVFGTASIIPRIAKERPLKRTR